MSPLKAAGMIAGLYGFVILCAVVPGMILGTMLTLGTWGLYHVLRNW